MTLNIYRQGRFGAVLNTSDKYSPASCEFSSSGDDCFIVWNYLYSSEKLTIQGVYTSVADFILHYLKTKRHNNWIVNRYATPLNGQFHMFFHKVLTMIAWVLLSDPYTCGFCLFNNAMLGHIGEGCIASPVGIDIVQFLNL